MGFFKKHIRFGYWGVCFWTDRFIKKRFGGRAFGPLVFIRPKYRDRKDEGLFQHEMCHTRQFWYSIFHPWDRRYWGKLNREVEAYGFQVRCYPRTQWESKINLFASFIAHRYGLDVTFNEAKTLLQGEVRFL